MKTHEQGGERRAADGTNDTNSDGLQRSSHRLLRRPRRQPGLCLLTGPTHRLRQHELGLRWRHEEGHRQNA